MQGDRLRRVRQQRGLTQTALGKLVGQDGQYIYKVERGLRPSITTTTLARLVTALEVSADYLLGFSDCEALPAPGGKGTPARRRRATATRLQDQEGAPPSSAVPRHRNGSASTTAARPDPPVLPGHATLPVGAETAGAVAAGSQPRAPRRPPMCPHCAIPLQPLEGQPGLVCPACRYRREEG
jgi:transcriptional regulator with XRE-family HTH domain